MKEMNVPEELKGVFGISDLYTWTAIDSDTKLVPCWHVGTRGAESPRIFMEDLVSRLTNRIQLTKWPSGLSERRRSRFGDHVDCAMLVKQYSNEGAPIEASRRYSPSEFSGAEKNRIIKRCTLLLRWKRELRILYGILKKCQ